MALTVGTLSGAYAVPPPGDDRTGVDLVDLPVAEEASGEDGGSLADMTTGDTQPETVYEPTKTTEPTAATATETVSSLTAGETVPVGTLPVEVGAPATATATEATALEGDWQATVVDDTTLAGRDINGLVFQVDPPDTATGDAVVALDYTQFAELYGADWADRLQITKYPECFLTTPDTAGCSDPTEVDTKNVVEPTLDDVTGDGVLDGVRRVEATIDVAELTDSTAGGTVNPATATGKGVVTDGVYHTSKTGTSVRTASVQSGSSVLVATSSGSGAKGDFSATPLVSAGSWAAGNSSGSFTYTYGLQPPEVPNGPSPSIAFGYNSQVVDGRTSATNNQASWIGDGWEYNPGSVTRTYRSCRDDLTNGNNADHKTSDLCWGSDNATLTLGGTTTELVKDDTTGTWETAGGDGSRVELLKDTSLGNGDADGEYWRVTTTDGTQYYFGRNKLPGWAGGDDTTDSVLTVPVAGNQSGEPCHATAFADSFCDQGWRWNLDYVVDPQGNAMSLWWKKETNHYSKNLKFKAPVTYDRGGYLSRIDYGQRSDTLFSAEPLARVSFTVDERCFTEDGIACTNDNFTSGDWAKTHIWYDTPADLYCSGASGKECFVPVPTFWSRKRLAQVTSYAQRTKGSTALSKVDSWNLEQSLPAERTDEGTALWLESITRKGYDTAGKALSLRPVTFVANTESMPNRVKEGAGDPNPTFDRLRIERVVNEYGGETLVDYAAPAGACATGTGFPKPEENTGLCFPAYWHPDPDKADESIDWFNKYVVDNVQELSGMTGVPAVTTSYEYEDDAGHKNYGAWALNQAEFSKKKTRTYDQWRGFGLVRTIGGADDSEQYASTERSMSETRYFRGMDGDPLPDGTTRSVTVKDSTGATIAPDKLPYQGRVAETLTYTKYGGTLLTRDVEYPTYQVLATRVRDGGIPALKAYRVLDDHTISVTRSSGTGDDTRTSRTVKTSTTYDDTYGLPVQVDFLGDKDKTGDESCTVTSYVHNTTKWLIGLPKQTLTTAGTCADAATATADDWIAGSRIAYDGGAYGDAPTGGLATTTWDVSGGGGSWTQSAALTYDAYGRSKTTTDAAGNKDTTDYDPPTGQTYTITSTNALGHETVSTIEPGRGTTLTEKDANGHTTTYAYDALGRTVAGWKPSQSTSGNPSVKFTYNTTPDEPVSVVTSALNDRGTYEDSVVFYDGLGRERQTQESAVGKGRLITDVHYSANGTIERTDNAYYAPGDPQTVMFEVASDFQIPNATMYAYDGLGREVSETPYEAGTVKPEKSTRYVYGYDYSTVIEPDGAAAQRSWSDALGRTVRVDTFTDKLRSAHRETRYEFDARGDQVEATDTKGNSWSWTYDARGRRLSATDPDTGTTSTTYDVLDRPVTTTDARGVKVWTGYDELSRPTEQRLDSSTGTLLAQNAYDELIGGAGLPSSATRYTDGLPYTTKITGYTDDYQPTGKQITLPPLVAQKYGLAEMYTYSYEYSDSGLLKSVNLPKAGALDAEKVVTRYNEDGLPVSTSGLDWYTADTTYSPYGQVLRAVSGEHPNRVWTTNLFDERTGALTRSIVDRESTTDTTGVAGHRVNSRTYGYDNAGNVTKIEDTVDSITDRQCFSYDVIGQLTQAWTASDSACATNTDGTPTSATAGTRGDGYYKSYEYDELGNRKKLVEHDTSGNTAKDATTTYAYGKADGTQPHTLTGMSHTYTADSGAQVTEASTLTYDTVGNTETRTYAGDEQALSWTWDGQVEKITGFGEDGQGAFVNTPNDKCLDLQSASTAAGTPVQIYDCNGTKAQKFRIDSADPANPSTGALKILGKCVMPSGGGTANGTAVVVADCTGADGQKWTATATGTLKHVASGKCLDVPSSDFTSGKDLQLYTCNSSDAQVWVPADETTYVYGPDGERLMALSAADNVLYLDGTTVATTANGTPAYTERYYAQPGAPTVMRHVQGSNKSTLHVQATDQNGTAYADVTLAAGNRVEFSRTDAFGVKRSEHNSWRSHQSYIGGDDDTSGGLVHLGAREYDPSTGRFLSPDPVLDLDDPVQMNGYVYCENNPVTFSDPSGLMSVADGGGGGGGDYGGPSGSDVAWANKQMHTSLTDIILSVGGAMLKEFLGWNDIVGCFSRGDLWSCGSLIIDAIPWGKLAKIPAVLRMAKRVAGAVSAWRSAVSKARKIIELAKKAAEMARKAKAAAKAAAKKAAQLAKKKAKEAATRAAKAAAKKTGNRVQKARKAAAKASEKVKTGYQRARSKLGGGKCNSFVPGTPVLMADGTAKPIEDVKNGDKVVATDPETGETSTETVTAEIKGHGLKHLVKVTIDTDGDKGDKTASITATDGHPIWVPALNKWVKATDLKSGEWLQTSAGTYVQITAIERWTAQTSTVHNLTVDDLHTYYVLAGATPVLVHNCNGATLELKYKKSWDEDQIAAADRKVAALNTAGADGKLVVTKVERSGSAADMWRRAGNETVEGSDIDHIIELQLGGADDVGNMIPLNSSVNRSIGSQISRQLKKQGLKPGDRVCKINISKRC
ncbi:ricin-type beta-trefoil lectin domain protein [Streptomyces sp. NBC_00996]|uniref:ricin-type beta-trefoil lectin domain protein n=1 Tax=Streptomyces sp. NBC_00996 TaxID=2903710 RepID=UPI00386E75DE